MIWIDYLSSNLQPPPIATVIPAPINPKLLWEANKQFGAVESLSKAEQEADCDNLRDEDHCAEDKPCNSSDSSEDSDCLRELSAALSQRKGKRQSTDTRSKKKRVTKSSIQYIITALANMKSAANYVLQKKLAVGAIELSNLAFKDLSYQQIFQRKVITAADYTFYQLHTSHDAILTAIDEDIRNDPPFEWLPLSILSQQQLEAREQSRLQQINESKLIKRMCDHILTREKEKMFGETVERLTNVAQEKQMSKEIARQVKEAEKEDEKRKKAGMYKFVPNSLVLSTTKFTLLLPRLSQEQKEQKKLAQELNRQEKLQQKLAKAMEKKSSGGRGKKRKQSAMSKLAEFEEAEGYIIMMITNTYMRK